MNHSIFRAFFPLPRYLRMPSVGLDISDKSIRFLGFKEVKGKVRIDRYAEEKLPEGIVVQGKIKDERKMRDALVRFRKEHNLDFVRVSLPEEQAYLFHMHLPLLRKSELKGSISLQLEEYVPIKAPDAVFDYEITSERADGYGLQVSAIPHSIVESYADIFRQSGLVPLSFEIEAQAIARAVVPKADEGTCMVIDFGQARTGISIVSRGTVVFTSTVEIGGGAITEAIGKELSVSSGEAEEVKRERGLARGEGKEDKTLFSAVLSVIAPLRDEINKHYIYWHTHKEGEANEGRRIEKIYLCGGDSNLKGLPEYLSQTMRLPVELANVWVNLGDFGDYVPEITFSNSLTYATAIGLALADTQP